MKLEPIKCELMAVVSVRYKFTVLTPFLTIMLDFILLCFNCYELKSKTLYEIISKSYTFNGKLSNFFKLLHLRLVMVTLILLILSKSNILKPHNFFVRF